MWLFLGYIFYLPTKQWRFCFPNPIHCLFRTCYKEACDWDGEPVSVQLEGGEGQLPLPLMEEVFSPHWVHPLPISCIRHPCLRILPNITDSQLVDCIWTQEAGISQHRVCGRAQGVNDKMTANCIAPRENIVKRSLFKITKCRETMIPTRHCSTTWEIATRQKSWAIPQQPLWQVHHITLPSGVFLHFSLLPEQRTLQLYVHRFLTGRVTYSSRGTYLSWTNFFPINFTVIMGLCQCSRREQTLYFFLKHIDLTKSTELTHSTNQWMKSPNTHASSCKSKWQNDFRGSAILFRVEKSSARKDLAIVLV